MSAAPLTGIRAVVGASFTVDLSDGTSFLADRVEHEAYLYRGRFYRLATAFSAHHRAAEVPVATAHPGAWFDRLADEIEARVGQGAAA